MNIESKLSQILSETILKLYNIEDNTPLGRTRKEFIGDYTLTIFKLSKDLNKSPQELASELEKALILKEEIESCNIVKGFFNIKLIDKFILSNIENIKGVSLSRDITFNKTNTSTTIEKGDIIIEYSSPNTNKPLHLGHIRNNLLGYSVSQISKAAGYNVVQVNLVNDRGVHICKSMRAWELFSNGETPSSSGIKGDHLVGKYYVLFDKELKRQAAELESTGIPIEEALKKAPIMEEIQTMLHKWESSNPEVRKLWETMNSWVYEGFKTTYDLLGISFDKTYYESQTYLLGKEIVKKGLSTGVLYKKEDGSVWIDLQDDGLDSKLLLRSDGTSVYMTQDLGTAVERVKELSINKMVYVVGNEQNYHFQVLKLVLKKLGYAWADDIFHLSYGMVELPDGKMKSREGTVVDADDLIKEMVTTAKEAALELGKMDDLDADTFNSNCNNIGLGALKYFMLKVDPAKKMLFDPKESIDFNGNTAPFIQYTFVRCLSLLAKAGKIFDIDNGVELLYLSHDSLATLSSRGMFLEPLEREIILHLDRLPVLIESAASNYSPALVANYTYDLSKLFNSFYHEFSILKEDNIPIKEFRLELVLIVAATLKWGFSLLGISMPTKM